RGSVASCSERTRRVSRRLTPMPTHGAPPSRRRGSRPTTPTVRRTRRRGRPTRGSPRRSSSTILSPSANRSRTSTATSRAGRCTRSYGTRSRLPEPDWRPPPAMTTVKHPGAPVERRRHRRLDLTTPTLLSLPLAWLLVFFVVPIVFVGGYSVGALSLFPGAHKVSFA